MKIWKCQLTPESLDLLDRWTGLGGMENTVEIPAPPDTPAMHIRERAVDAVILLIQQEQHGLTTDQMGELRQQLNVQCGEVGDV